MASPDGRLPGSQLVQDAIVCAVEMDGRERDRAFFDRLVVGIFAAAPGHASSRDPIIGPTVWINLLNDRILESPPAQARHTHTGNVSQRTIGDVEIDERFLRQSTLKDQARDAQRIMCAGGKVKLVAPFL